jgi:hypothetical protein
MRSPAAAFHPSNLLTCLSLVAGLGKPASRAVLGLTGLALIALGIALALGWRLNRL